MERCDIRGMRSLLVVVSLAIVSAVCGCSNPPKLTAEDRGKDIEFLAKWAREYNPLVELNEKHKGTPSYEALLPRYVEFAKQAQSEEEFCLVVCDYFRVIGASGHAYLVPDRDLKWNGIGSLFRVVKWPITYGQFQRARYWPRLAGRVSTRAHPPFPVAYRNGRYFTGDDWRCDGTVVPGGSEILRVDGLTCSRYLEFIKANTSLKYDAYPKEWADSFLMIVDEGPAFKGWQVDFRRPDGTELSAFAPKVRGFPAPAEETPGTTEPRDNCTCVELTDHVGYIRVRSFLGHPLDFVFKRFIERDRRKIRTFLERSRGQYDKLIIDIRNNGGGLPEYYYRNLIAPFLDEPVTWKETVGVKRKLLADTKPSVVRYLRRDVKPRQVAEREVEPPAGFDKKAWVFFELTRRVEPSSRYDFHGTLYVLINGNCYSAADGYSDTIKRTRIGSLAGRSTGGARANYLLPPMIRLPASGMVFRVEADLDMNPDGSVNELVGTAPDLELPQANPPASITREDLLKDEWIKRVIAER